MLVEFRAENHRSLREEQVLTMEPPGGGTPLTVAAIFGANASGKSNVLDALAYMAHAVRHSQRFWDPDGGVPRTPFAWGGGPAKPSAYEATFLLEGVRHEYGFAVTNDAVVEEWLFAWPNGRKQTWFERDGADIKFGENLRGENRLIQEATRHNSLFLSAATQLNHKQLRPVYGWFRSILMHHVRQPIFHRPGRLRLARALSVDPFFPMRDLGEKDGSLESIRDLLQQADLGIVDVRVAEGPETDGSSPWGRRVQLRHHPADESAWLDLADESGGTQALFDLAPALSSAWRNGRLLLVDELEANLHPAIARAIVRQFADPSTNPRGAQILFTTHDSNLLGNLGGEPALTRESTWLTKKDPDGGTQLYPLTDYKPRSGENLERGYLQGRYGAVPLLGDLLQGLGASDGRQPAP